MFMVAFVLAGPFCVLHPHKCWPPCSDKAMKWCLMPHTPLNLCPLLFLRGYTDPGISKPGTFQPLVSLPSPWNAPPLVERRPIPRFSWSLLFISCLSESLNLSVLLLKNKFMVFIQAQGRFQDLEKQNKKQVAYLGGGGQKKSESEKRWKKHVGYQFQAHGVTWKMVFNHRLGFILNFFVKWQHSQRVATNSNQTLLTISCIQ